MNCLSTRVCYKRPAVFRTLPVRQPAHFPGSSRRFSRHPGPRARPSCRRYTPSCRNTSDCRCRRIWRRSVQCCRSTAWTRARRWITVTWTATRWAAIFTAGILWTWGCRAYRRTWARRTTRTRIRRRRTTRSGSRARKCWEWRRRRRYVRRTINCESSFTDFCKYEKLVPGNLTHIWYQRKCFARVINLQPARKGFSWLLSGLERFTWHLYLWFDIDGYLQNVSEENVLTSDFQVNCEEKQLLMLYQRIY